jgi:hypothetical protein
LGRRGIGVVTVFTTDVVVAFGAVVGRGTLLIVIDGAGVVTVFGAVVFGNVVNDNAAFF